MLDVSESRIARMLAEHHYYPYGADVYLNIFRHFSHFPLELACIDTDLEGETVTYLALVVYECLNRNPINFIDLYESVLKKFKKLAEPHLPQDVTVETFLGCILYYYHATNVRSALMTMDVNLILKPEYLYEYEMKKRTVLIHLI